MHQHAYIILVLIGTLVFVISLYGPAWEKRSLSASILAVITGFVASLLITKMARIEVNNNEFLLLSELALGLVLFCDAAETNYRTLGQHLGLPARLLFIGLPLTLVVGTLLGQVFFVQMGFLEIAIVATILAPTDAALGKPVVTNRKVSGSIREGLKVESGLNDGICVPVLFLLISLLGESATHGITPLVTTELFVHEIGVGILVGLVFVFLANLLLKDAFKQHIVSESWRAVVVVALDSAIFALTQLLGGSGFIACFVGGLFHGRIHPAGEMPALKSAEGLADALSLATWFFFGFFMVPAILDDLTFEVVAYSLLSLTLIRMLPVMLSLWKTHYNWRERIFVGWFGPRGLASVVFVLILGERLDHIAHMETITSVVSLTILLSIFAHGFSALPLINWVKFSDPED